MDEAQIAALLRERKGYVDLDKPERVALVDIELKKLGYKSSRAEVADEAKSVRRGNGPAVETRG